MKSIGGLISINSARAKAEWAHAPGGRPLCVGSEVMCRVTTRLFTKQRKSVTKVQRFSETRVQQNRQQQYSVFGNKSVALDSGASSVSGGTFESDTRIPIRLGMTFEGEVLANVIGHFFAKVNGHRCGSEFAIIE